MTELKIKIEHATVKHQQTIGALERCHSSLKRFLHSQTGKNFPNWHRRLSFATYAYNTTYHTAIGTTPTQVFHGRDPIRPLDVRFSGVLHPTHIKSLDTQKNPDNHNELYDQTKRQSLFNFQQYRGYFDRKAKANPLQKGDFCFLLNPEVTKQNDRLAIGECKWVGLYKVEECLTHSNYMIRKVNTNLTQIVHRIRLRKYIPPHQPVDIIVSKGTKFEADTEFPNTLEPNLMDMEKIEEEPLDNHNSPAEEPNLYSSLY